MKEKKLMKLDYAKDRTQILTKLTAIFKFPRHPQKLVQNNNWCGMVSNKIYKIVYHVYKKIN